MLLLPPPTILLRFLLHSTTTTTTTTATDAAAFFPIVADAISATAAITSAFDSLETRDSGSVALQFYRNIVLKILRCIFGTRDFLRGGRTLSGNHVCWVHCRYTEKYVHFFRFRY